MVWRWSEVAGCDWWRFAGGLGRSGVAWRFGGQVVVYVSAVLLWSACVLVVVWRWVWWCSGVVWWLDGLVVWVWSRGGLGVVSGWSGVVL